jgi:hypothetical protein
LTGGRTTRKVSRHAIFRWQKRRHGYIRNPTKCSFDRDSVNRLVDVLAAE